MAGPRKLPPTPALVALAEAGYLDREIGDMFGVSRQAVAHRLAGLDITRAQRVPCPACHGSGTVAPVALRVGPSPPLPETA
ncbi:hypothetical protein [Pseudonocardia parietis]|uniref:Transcriptional regulator n=1 Tax=Pseudonocardia parietis TaxID=570936 RepID=A0ABS4W268_9PSEU|nr:hypothetical protein [Pseudonocardia parietis]MBP2370255.1 putative transcriptional regulator [Pseudonocardia parietis]